MDIENNFIKPILLFHFSKGKNETEAYKEISKQYGQYAITLRTTYKWFEVFRSEYQSSVNEESSSKEKHKDKVYIDLIKDNYGLDEQELAKLSNCSKLTISTRLNNINNNCEAINYHMKDEKNSLTKFTDEYLIDLVNKNPDLNIEELAKLAHTSSSVISRRLRQINSNEQVVRYNCKKALSGTPKTPGKPKKFTDEYLINLVNENPELKMEELAKITNSSTTTISNRLKKINSEGIKVDYAKKKTHKVASKVGDELLLDTVNENSDINLDESEKFSNFLQPTISSEQLQINIEGEVYKFDSKITKKHGYKKDPRPKKYTDEFIINLVNENPDLNISELSRLSGASKATISTRLKKINESGEIANYSKKYTQMGAKLFTDEFLINLIKENPKLNMAELAKLANTTAGTISRRLKQINMGEEMVHYSMKGCQKDVNNITEEYLIDLINNNPSLNMEELGKLAGTSGSVVSRMIKRINRDGERVKYISKINRAGEHNPNRKSTKKFTDEFLINLINENPSLNMEELSKLAGTSRVTISNRLKQINSTEKKVNYNPKKVSKNRKAQTDSLYFE